MNNDRHAGDSLLNEQLHSAEVTLSSKLSKLNNNSEWLGYDADMKKIALLDLRDQYPYEQQAYQALLDHELEQGNKSAALEIGRTMLTMNPTDNKLREQIADLMRDDENITDEQVGQFIDESYSVLPDDPKWGYFKAMRCWQREDYDSTLVVLERALQHAEEPTVRLTILVLYGDILGHVKNYEKAFEAYDEVLKLAPDHISTLNNYAWTLAISGGDLKKAEKMSQRTIQKEGNNPTYLDTYAWILHLQGQDQLALFYIKKAMEYASGDDGTIAEHYEQIKNAANKE
jgi:tetratricopeptide (TPR) repeat protein